MSWFNEAVMKMKEGADQVDLALEEAVFNALIPPIVAFRKLVLKGTDYLVP
jgi:hypothetical protein